MQQNTYTMTHQKPAIPFVNTVAGGQKHGDEPGPLPINLSADEIRAMIREVMG